MATSSGGKAPTEKAPQVALSPNVHNDTSADPNTADQNKADQSNLLLDQVDDKVTFDNFAEAASKADPSVLKEFLITLGDALRDLRSRVHRMESQSTTYAEKVKKDFNKRIGAVQANTEAVASQLVFEEDRKEQQASFFIPDAAHFLPAIDVDIDGTDGTKMKPTGEAIKLDLFHLAKQKEKYLDMCKNGVKNDKFSSEFPAMVDLIFKKVTIRRPNKEGGKTSLVCKCHSRDQRVRVQ